MRRICAGVTCRRRAKLRLWTVVPAAAGRIRLTRVSAPPAGISLFRLTPARNARSSRCSSWTSSGSPPAPITWILRTSGRFSPGLSPGSAPRSNRSAGRSRSSSVTRSSGCSGRRSPRRRSRAAVRAALTVRDVIAEMKRDRSRVGPADQACRQHRRGDRLARRAPRAGGGDGCRRRHQYGVPVAVLGAHNGILVGEATYRATRVARNIARSSR